MPRKTSYKKQPLNTLLIGSFLVVVVLALPLAIRESMKSQDNRSDASSGRTLPTPQPFFSPPPVASQPPVQVAKSPYITTTSLKGTAKNFRGTIEGRIQSQTDVLTMSVTNLPIGIVVESCSQSEWPGMGRYIRCTLVGSARVGTHAITVTVAAQNPNGGTTTTAKIPLTLHNLITR